MCYEQTTNGVRYFLAYTIPILILTVSIRTYIPNNSNAKFKKIV